MPVRGASWRQVPHGMLCYSLTWARRSVQERGCLLHVFSLRALHNEHGCMLFSVPQFRIMCAMLRTRPTTHLYDAEWMDINI